MNIKSINIILFIIVFSHVLCAQTSVDSDDKKSVEINIVGAGKVTYEKGIKINEEPEFKDTVKVKSEFNYTTTEQKIEGEYEVEPINAPKITILEPLQKLYKANLTLGVNDFVTPPYFDFSYTKLRDKKFSAGFNLNHFSSGIKADGLNQSKFQENNIGVFGKKITEKHTFYANADYEYDRFRYYGFDQNIFEIPKDSSRIYYSLLNANIGFKKNVTDEKEWNYKANIAYDQFFSADEIQEHLITASTDLGKFFEPTFLNKFFDKKGVAYFDGKASVAYLSSQDSIQNINSTLIEVTPTANLKHDRLDMTIGFRMNYFTGPSNSFRLYPIAELDFTVAKDILIIYGSIDGEYKRNHYLTYFQSNPFISTQLNNTTTNNSYNIVGGLKGALSSKSSFNVGFKSMKFNDEVFFVNDLNTKGNRKFTIWQTDLNQEQLFGEFIFENKKFRTNGLLELNTYSTAQYEAFHRPDLYAELGLSYNLQDKIKVGTDLYYFGTQIAPTEDVFVGSNDVSTVTLDPILDFNFNVNYIYSNKFNAFVLVNNILSQNHQRWNQYPNYGINFMLGLNYSF